MASGRLGDEVGAPVRAEGQVVVTDGFASCLTGVTVRIKRNGVVLKTHRAWLNKLYGRQVVCHTTSMPEDFLDREDESAALDREWRRPGASLILLWGRRRTGKTRLLGRFIQSKRAIFYGAAQQSSAIELEGFSNAARNALQPTGSDLLAHGNFPDWETALSYLGERARRQRLAVVLDEFPYLTDAEPALPSIIQRFWDHAGRRTKLFLVLCGSAQSVMEDLQSQRAPLFGRVDFRLQLQPFGYADAARFVPRLSPVERAIAYGVVGGMPVYLTRWDDSTGHRANLRRLFGNPTSPLVEEGEFVLSSELPEASGYFRILHGIASGHRTYGAIKKFADIDIQRQMDRLLRLGLIERVVPVTEDPSRTKRAVYRVADNFLNFWFRFVYRHRADIARGLGPDIVEQRIVPHLSDHMGEPWEEMCREFLRRQVAGGDLTLKLSTIGRWWNRDNSVEIDIVGLNDKKVVLAGSVKWSRSAGRQELDALRRAVGALPNRADRVTLALFAREEIRGIHPDEALAFTAEDLYRDSR